MTPERWQRVNELFHAARERAAGERVAFLDEACAGDAELRRQVEALVAADEEPSDFLVPPAFKALSQSSADELDMAGRRIGPYQVLRAIGHGGMGTVYLAERADGQFRKQVAIKIVKRGMDSQAILLRFRQEQQILANLSHPNISKLLDGGTTEEGLSYFIMDYVEGLPIDTYCDRRQLPAAERLQLFRTVCSAVHYAHQNHVIHRDLKPSNIMVTAEGVPTLLDFGIAKVLDPELSSATNETTTADWRPMTRAYASPEQLRGGPVTPVSDVYSLGVLLYELLTGHRPYRVQSRTPQEIERVICAEEPEKPSLVVSRVEEVSGASGVPITIPPASVSATRGESPEALRRSLTGDLDQIVLMALRKEPERRYAAVEQFSDDIRRHLEGLPVMARKDTLASRSAKIIKRNKASVIAATFVLVALLAVIGVEFYRFIVARNGDSLARRNTALKEPVDPAVVLGSAHLALSEPVNLGAPVNSEAYEGEPAISPNGLSLYFASNRAGGLGANDLWVSQRARLRDPWAAPKNLGPNINSRRTEATPTFSPDGHWLYFSSRDRPDSCGGADLYVVWRRDPTDDFGWEPAVNLGCTVNSPWADFGAYYFKDEETGIATLYFHSVREGGLGGADIYASTRRDDGSFGPPVLVRELSSPLGDWGPRVRVRGLELFLTSNRPGGFGSMDLWVSTRTTTREAWPTPVNLGPVVNTGAYEGSLGLSFDGATLYFSSNRPGGHSDMDLYMTKLKK